MSDECLHVSYTESSILQVCNTFEISASRATLWGFSHVTMDGLNILSLSAGAGAIAVRQLSQEGVQGVVEAGVGAKKRGAEAEGGGLLQHAKALQVQTQQ